MNAELHKIFNRFAGQQDGIAAVEFAMILPMVAMLFFGIVEFSDAMAANRKAEHATTMLVDLVSQEEFLTEDEIDGIYTAVDHVLGPYGIQEPQMWVASVTIDEDDKPIIDWSLDQDLAEPFARGSEFSALSESELDLTGHDALITEGASLIVAKIEFGYTSSLTKFHVDSFTLSNHDTRWPRRGTQIVYCDASDNCSNE
ncbi:TadE/TadG family type IV pilus assembly protein [Parvularcula sp. IMCC14364]|uniref:TadE/TadG family type IV pilus assembly protein n=1 Tax=Parvularcula sp. IMCC14364 TaxID=3067902 RepID=UPI0027417BB5|nr:TadE/TadG family type IV pilus assembly protein [Parvularcula sp. IMCC14364]